jgi:hypothetical protein
MRTIARPALCGIGAQSPNTSLNAKKNGPIRLKPAEWLHFALFKKTQKKLGFALF